VGIAPELSLRWLVHAERVLVSLGSNLWPESVLRDESLAALGIADLGPFLGDVPTLDPADALAEAGAWLARRDPEEAATRPRGLVAWAVREDRGDPPLATAPPVAGTQPAGRSRSSRNATARG
jgi:hypothetical protein